jgi:hypothetical protein
MIIKSFFGGEKEWLSAAPCFPPAHQRAAR